MIFFIIISALLLLFVLFMQQPQFGRLPSGMRLERIKKSPNYREGKFQNLSITPDLAEGVSFFQVLKDVLFGKSKRSKPKETIPSKKTNLLQLDPNKDVLVWFGHSSYFIQVDGRKILVDPVFSGSASPLPRSVLSFKGTDVYTADDIPEIDYLIISHDHWDHLDYKTVSKLQAKTKTVITGLGTAAHLERWGFDIAKVIEKDWNEEVVLEEGFVINTLPARHFSGRSFKRQQAIWLSFALKTPTMNLFLGGDSGYDTHFATIGKKFGPFDLAILECGQYNESWKYIHCMPEEVVMAAQDLRAKRLLPVHWGKFSLALHSWDEPINRVTASAKLNDMPTLTPMMGEEVRLKDAAQTFTEWWKQVK